MSTASLLLHYVYTAYVCNGGLTVDDQSKHVHRHVNTSLVADRDYGYHQNRRDFTCLHDNKFRYLSPCTADFPNAIEIVFTLYMSATMD